MLTSSPINYSKNKINHSKEKRIARQEKLFPYVLWKIVNECTTEAIKWAPNGNSILIDFNKFEKQYLGKNDYFKTKKILSFVRQLNIYGFTKISNRVNQINRCSNSILQNDQQFEYHKFHQKYFKKDEFGLLKYIVRRNTDIIKNEKTFTSQENLQTSEQIQKLTNSSKKLILIPKNSRSDSQIKNSTQVSVVYYTPIVLKNITNNV